MKPGFTRALQAYYKALQPGPIKGMIPWSSAMIFGIITPEYLKHDLIGSRSRGIQTWDNMNVRAQGFRFTNLGPAFYAIRS